MASEIYERQLVVNTSFFFCTQASGFNCEFVYINRLCALSVSDKPNRKERAN